MTIYRGDGQRAYLLKIEIFSGQGNSEQTVEGSTYQSAFEAIEAKSKASLKRVDIEGQKILETSLDPKVSYLH
jgi:hypothetical protein